MSLPFSNSVQPLGSNSAKTLSKSLPPRMSLVLGLGLGMAAIIAGTVFSGKSVAFCSIPLFIIAVVAFSLYKPVAALAYYFTYSALEGMYKYLSDFSQVVYVIKPVLATILLLAWLMSMRMMPKRFLIPPLASALTLLMAWGSLEIFHPTGAGIAQSALTFLIWYVIPLGFYFFSYNAIKTLKQAILVFSVLMIVSTVVSAFAIIQYDMGKTWTETHLPGYEEITQHNWWVTDEKGNVEGTTSWSPASTTAYCGTAALWGNIGAILALGLLFAPGGSKTQKISLSTCLLINVLALLIIGVRLWVIIFALEAIILFLLLLRSQRTTLHLPQNILRNLAYAAFFVVLLAVGYQAAQSLTGGMAAKRYEETILNPAAKFQKDRGGNMTYLPSFVLSNPLGVGYQRGTDGGDLTNKNINRIVTNRETEFNGIAADMGLPGLFLLILISISFLIQGWRSYECLRMAETKILAASLFVLLLGTLISYFGTPIIQGADYFWMTVGVLMGLPALEKRERLTEAVRLGETR